ncbi:MAG TPA: class I SAM-dependent methyltransferase [Pyrinomonadaceae bacterium]
MKNNQDAFGQQLLAQYKNETMSAEIIERDDNYIDFGTTFADLYFTEYKQWSPLEKRAIKHARGKILDIGCGAGRHALYLQQKGFDVTGIDNSAGAIKVSKLRGVKKALVRSIAEIDKFKPNSFDTILMLGNNFGLFADAENARLILEKMNRITTPAAKIIAGTRNPYKTADRNHLEYHKLNKKRGRMPAQIRMRVRYRKTVGEWFDYLFVSPAEMKKILANTNWQIEEFIEQSKDANYYVVINKKSEGNSTADEC